MAKPKADWYQIRLEYISSLKRMTFTELAEKYGLARMTVNNRAVKEGWNLQRDRHIARTEEQTTEKLEGIISDEGAKFDSEMFYRIRELLVRFDADIAKVIRLSVAKTYSQTFTALTSAQVVGKAALGDKPDTVVAFEAIAQAAVQRKP